MAAPSKKSLALFVSKIPWTVARKDLGEYFGQFGIVTWCKLPFSKETGFHKGHGWIAFKTEEGRDSALQKDLHVVEGATVYVQSYRDRQRFVINKSNGDTQHD